MNKHKIKLLTAALALTLAAFLSQGTITYYSTVGTATNAVTSGDIQLVIHEFTADGSPFPSEGIYVIPGDQVGKQVTIENICAHPFFLRVKLINGTVDGVEDVFRVNLNESVWSLREDGYLYYNEIVQPGQTTLPVFTQVEIAGEKIDQSDIGQTLTLSVIAHAVQSENNPADHPWEASGWPTE